MTDDPNTLRFEGFRDHVRLWIAMKARLIELRGSDAGANRKAIPRTSNSDVMQLAARWTQELTRSLVAYPHAGDYRTTWRAALGRIERQTAGKPPGEPYGENEWFWQEATQELAIWLASRSAVPTKMELAVESVAEAVMEVPATLGHAAKAAGHGAGNLLSGITRPLLIGAGVVGGAVLLVVLARRR